MVWQAIQRLSLETLFLSEVLIPVITYVNLENAYARTGDTAVGGY